MNSLRSYANSLIAAKFEIDKNDLNKDSQPRTALKVLYI